MHNLRTLIRVDIVLSLTQWNRRGEELWKKMNIKEAYAMKQASYYRFLLGYLTSG